MSVHHLEPGVAGFTAADIYEGRWTMLETWFKDKIANSSAPVCGKVQLESLFTPLNMLHNGAWKETAKNCEIKDLHALQNSASPLLFTSTAAKTQKAYQTSVLKHDQRQHHQNLSRRKWLKGQWEYSLLSLLSAESYSKKLLLYFLI